MSSGAAGGAPPSPRARPRLRSCLYPCSLRASRSVAACGARVRAGRAQAGARVCLPACARPRLAARYSAMEARLGSRSSEGEEEGAPPPVVRVPAAVRRAGGVLRRATGRLVESTQAEDRRLIGLVGARPLLYARSTLPVASYYSQVKKLWQEVADLMGWTVAEVRRKWSHIRNSYSRHLRNEIHGLRTGRGRMVSRWYLADDLEFLRQHMATDTRPSASYSMVTMSPFAPSLLQMEVSSVEDEPDGAAAGAGVGAGGTGAMWYSTPEGPPHDDSCGAHSFEPDETADYFHFFRGLYSDYQDLTPVKQRKFRRQCLVLLHELVDEAGGGEEAGGASDADEDHKCFVENLEIINGTGADTTGADTTGTDTTGASGVAADAADAR